MKNLPAILLASACLVNVSLRAQSSTFDLAAYRQFLSTHQDLETAQLLALHPSAPFKKSIYSDPAQADYFQKADSVYQFTPGEIKLLEEHGFVVSERLSRNSFGEALVEIYRSDLPVFVSSDAILHPIHMSYDFLLRGVEMELLIPELDTLLSRLHGTLPVLSARYQDTPGMTQSLKDVDVYLSVARNLLTGSSVSPVFGENWSTIASLLSYIGSLQPMDYPLFSSQSRTLDFSQFKVRGHYTHDPELGRYFQAMIWLGRTELYLIGPESNGGSTQDKENEQRQAVDALLILEAIEEAEELSRFERIDRTIQLFVGESDNVTVANLMELRTGAAVSAANDLLDGTTFQRFQDFLTQQPYVSQRILSQIITSDPLSPEQIKPASAFLLLGQRFVIDSYVTASVVYDRIVYKGSKATRMLPKSLDILFALGNNAAAELLQPELETFHYGTNLAALRYLVDSYNEEFWLGSIYNGWLQAIRALNVPNDRQSLPAFMQTAAWWQEKMNTQLASWAQLRHDNILYAKQSYSGSITCSFPEGYVEPIPEFYAAVKKFADHALENLQALGIGSGRWYFRYLGAIADTLGSIATKTLKREPLSSEEGAFLKGMLRMENAGCGVEFDGWYPRLFYAPEMFLKNFVVADVHTAPTDEAGNAVGWVLHAGTGPVNLAVVTAPLPNGRLCTFTGPVMSYYEYLATGFQRLNDEEWETQYALAPAARPTFVNLYLADAQGSERPGAMNLTTDAGQDLPIIPAGIYLAQNYPNPFNPSTVIEFNVPGPGEATLRIFDLLGREVATPFEGEMSQGQVVRTLFRADGLAGGMYVARLEFLPVSGTPEVLHRKLLLLK